MEGFVSRILSHAAGLGAIYSGKRFDAIVSRSAYRKILHEVIEGQEMS
jgi:hypothetical protein